MGIEAVASSRPVMRLGMFVSQHVPRGLVERLAWSVAGVLCRLKPAAYYTVLGNLRHVMGAETAEAALVEATRRVFYTTMDSAYELFWALSRPEEELSAHVDFPAATLAVASTIWQNKGGTVLVFPHLGSFDLAGVILATHLPPIQTLSLANPGSGFRWVNELRERTGARMTPLSPTALREALRHLRGGGVLGVAGDRPVSELDEPVPFFGRPARMPSGHIRLALQTGAAIVVGYCPKLAETGQYTMHLDPPLEVVRTGDREEDMRLNMQRVLQALEEPIRRWPEQWQMYVPVWPDVQPA